MLSSTRTAELMPVFLQTYQRHEEPLSLVSLHYTSIRIALFKLLSRFLIIMLDIYDAVHFHGPPDTLRFYHWPLSMPISVYDRPPFTRRIRRHQQDV